MRCTKILDKSKCMHSRYVPGAFSMHWKGLEMRLARQLLCAHKKVVVLLQFYVQTSNGSHNLFYLFHLDAALNCMWAT